MTPSEELANRYKQIEREADAFNRMIGVKRLKVSQQVRINEMTPNLDGESEMTTADGRQIRIPRRSLALVAASVCEIDGIMIPFAKSRSELDAVMDRLDEEGLAAAVLAYAKLQPSIRAAEEGAPEGTVDLAKK